MWSLRSTHRCCWTSCPQRCLVRASDSCLCWVYFSVSACLHLQCSLCRANNKRTPVNDICTVPLWIVINYWNLTAVFSWASKGQLRKVCTSNDPHDGCYLYESSVFSVCWNAFMSARKAEAFASTFDVLSYWSSSLKGSNHKELHFSDLLKGSSFVPCKLDVTQNISQCLTFTHQWCLYGVRKLWKNSKDRIYSIIPVQHTTDNIKLTRSLILTVEGA